ncbi:MAG: hypothetical protein EZS28_028705, partial [Streblomastix strix]
QSTGRLLSPLETLASPLYFEIAKWAAGTGCSVELPIPIGRPSSAVVARSESFIILESKASFCNLTY